MTYMTPAYCQEKYSILNDMLTSASSSLAEMNRAGAFAPTDLHEDGYTTRASLESKVHMFTMLMKFYKMMMEKHQHGAPAVESGQSFTSESHQSAARM